MTTDDKILLVDFYQFVCDNMNNYKSLSEAFEAFKKEKRIV